MMSSPFRLFQRGIFDLVLIDSDLEWPPVVSLSIIKKYSKYNNIPILKLSDNEHELNDDLVGGAEVLMA